MTARCVPCAVGRLLIITSAGMTARCVPCAVGRLLIITSARYRRVER
jgi:hypothetical protein